MERKYKVGDRVKTGFYRTGEPILAEILSGLTVGGYTVYTIKTDDGFELQSEGVGFTLIPPPKLPEPKFNPYDKVRVNIKNFTPFNAEVTAWFICGDHYLYELKTEDGGTLQSTGEGVELIEPKYKKGDKVWDKGSNGVWEFEEYLKLGRCIISYDGDKCASKLSDIEPYTGQDKVKEETKKERNTRLAAELIAEVTRLHPELKQVRSGKFLYNPNRKNVFSIDLVKEFKFTSPPYIWIETWEGTQFSIEDTDGKVKERIIKWTEE